MRRWPLNNPANGSSPNGGTIIAPPPGGSGPCSCSDLAIAWSDGTTSAAAIVGDTTLPVLVANGSICPDTVWTISSNWDPEDAGAAPVVEQVGASAWRVTAPASGILTLSASALCGGQTLAVGSVTLTIIEGTIYSGGGGQWVDISTLAITLEAIGSPSMSYAGGLFTDSQLQQVGHSIEAGTATIGYIPHGLDAAVGAVFARLRIRITSFDCTATAYNGYACGVDVPGTTLVEDSVTVIDPVELSTLVIVGGADSSGDQSGSFAFAIDVEVFQP